LARYELFYITLQSLSQSSNIASSRVVKRRLLGC